VFKLLPLYILWSLIFYGVFWLIPEWRAASAPQSLIVQLLTGKADYQLYFVPMIFQLYLLFPFLIKLLTKKPTIVLSLFFLFQLSVFAVYSLTADPRNWEKYLLSDQQQYVLCISWIFYFVLGMYLAKKQAFLRSKKLFAWLALGLGAASLLWATSVGIQQINLGLDPIIALRFTRWPILIYASSALVFLLIYKRATVGLPELVKKPMLFLGRHSYGIYLSHTLFLRILFTLL
jgi:membrane-bound acyltransferase YfiQ involved in biofilm formation